MPLTLTIDSVNRIDFLLHESLSISQTNDGLNSTCEFDLIDIAVIRADTWMVEETRVEDGDVITTYTTFYPDTKVEVSVTDGATTYFAGVLSSLSVEGLGQIKVGDYVEPTDKILHCACHDFNQILEESVVDDLEEYGASTVEEIIDDIFTKYVTGIDFATHVTAPFAIAEISFEAVTVRQVMDTLCAQSGYIWYVDYSQKLHCSAAEANSPAWHLSDVPDDVNSFAFFDDIQKDVDAVNLVNRVFVVGGIAGLWFEDDESIARYGLHQAIVRDTSLVDILDIEDKGESVLAAHKDPTVTYTVKTYKDGLRAGTHLRLVCAFLDVDATYLINSLTVTFPVDGEPVYEAIMGGLESSVSVSAHRLTMDQIHAAQNIIMSSQMPIASQGWGHDLVFTATDYNTVAWTAGTLTTAGGHSLAISAGNTDDPGAMVAKTIVYFDAAISVTELQMTTDETAAMGSNRIMVAVCWPGIVAAGDQPEVKAGFQVFGASSGGVQTFLNADNVAANCVTANEIYVNQLSAINANMGTLTAGAINLTSGGGFGRILMSVGGIALYDVAGNLRAYLNANDGTFELTSAEAGNPRIVIGNAEIAGYDGANVKQFYLSAADGVAYAGAGAVILDETGLRFKGSGASGDTRKLRFVYNDAGTEREMGTCHGDWGGGAGQSTAWLIAKRNAGDPWPANVVALLAAIDTIAGKDVRLYVQSGGIVSVSGSTYFETNADTRIGGGLYVGAVNVDPDTDDIWVVNDVRIGSGLYVGAAALDQTPLDNEIHSEGVVHVGTYLEMGSTTYKLRRNGTHIDWYNGTSWVQLD